MSHSPLSTFLPCSLLLTPLPRVSPARRLASRLSPLAVCLLLLTALLPALAQDRQAEIERDISSYRALVSEREQELAAIRADLETSSAELQAQIAERDRLARDIGALQSERQTLQAELAALEAQLEATQARIQDLDARLESLKDRVQALLINLYVQGGGARVASLLSEAASLHELQVKNHYLSLLSEQDVTLIAELDETLAQLAAEQQRYRDQFAEASAKEAALAENQAALERDRQAHVQAIARLEETQAGQRANQQVLLEEQSAFETRLATLARDLEAELARLARLEEERLAREAAEAAIAARTQQRQNQTQAPAQTPAPPVTRLQDLPPLTTGYIYPVEQPRLLRRYGEGGVSGIWLQTGQSGAAVRAVQPGLVIEARPGLANQGYIVVIRHAEGLVTAYVNLQSTPPVTELQQVTQGEVIGYLGGGALIPPNVLEFHAAWTSSGQFTWTDPAALLGF